MSVQVVTVVGCRTDGGGLAGTSAPASVHRHLHTPPLHRHGACAEDMGGGAVSGAGHHQAGPSTAYVGFSAAQPSAAAHH